jgi:hypothetical protein
MGRVLGVPLEFFSEQDSDVGEWHKLQEDFEHFCELPLELRNLLSVRLIGATWSWRCGWQPCPLVLYGRLPRVVGNHLLRSLE